MLRVNLRKTTVFPLLTLVLLVCSYLAPPPASAQVSTVTSSPCEESISSRNFFVGRLEPGEATPGATFLTVSTVQRLATGIETFNKTVGLLEDITGQQLPANTKIPVAFIPALLKDIEDARAKGGKLSPPTSHTLEQIGKFGLKTLPTMVEGLKREGRLPAKFKIPPTTFGIDEFVAGGASHFGRGRMGIEEVTHYLDGFSKMTAAVLGYLVAGPQGAKIGESAAGLAQVTFRGLTMPIFQEVANQPVRQDMIRNWQVLQEARILHGQPVQRFTQLYPATDLKRIGFIQETVSELDRYADWVNAAKGGTQLHTPLLPLPDVSTPDKLQVVVGEIDRVNSKRIPLARVGGVWLCAQYQTVADETGEADALGQEAVRSRPESGSRVWEFEKSGQKYKAGSIRTR